MRFVADFFKTIHPFSLILVFLPVFLFWHFAPRAESAETPENSFEPANYDIRTDKSAGARQAIDRFIADAGKTAELLAADREKMRRAEQAPRSNSVKLKIEYNEDLRIPETIAPADSETGRFLTPPSTAERAAILRAFLKQNSALIGLRALQIDALTTTADYTNPVGNLSFVHFEQRIKNVPVFRGEVKAGFTKRGELVRVINNLAPKLDDENLATDFGSAETAVKSAAQNINAEIGDADTQRIESASSDLKIVFERGQFADRTTAEKMYFPIDAGIARTAWRVLLWTRADAFYLIVDAQTGTLLWRKDITAYQSLPATFNVYGNAASLLKTADSPAPLTPGCITPLSCPEPTLINRQSFTLVGNETPYVFNNLGWIPDTGLPVRTPADNNVTDGNAVEAGLDRDGTQGVDAPVAGNPNRVFNFTYNPAPGNPPPGEGPLTTEYQKGSVTQAFYAVNRWHDELYLLGFTEAARNFQHFNFGRGGTEGDRISAEIQDSSGTNSASMTTPADGGRPRLQMFIWTGTTPNRDGALDGQVLIHEVTHGLSNRLIGNSTGLVSPMASGMGEGWSDFFALALLAEPTDAIAATYPIGSYAPFGALPGSGDYYYGIRRFPTAVKSFVGDNGFPHNPLTFGNLNQGNCTTFNSAFPQRFVSFSSCSQVIYIGEVWENALWEIRARFIQRLGAAEGNRRILQFIMDGMKLSPINPTFFNERDAMLAAAQASGTSEDRADIWAGFAIRGLGFSAQITSTNPLIIVEAFDTPNLTQSPSFSFTDPAPGGNGNGYAERGETILLSIPLTNPIGTAANNTTLQIVGGGSVNYGTIQSGQTVTQTIYFTVPNNAPCGADLPLIFNVDSSLGATTFNRPLPVGLPVISLSENFDSVSAPALPPNWSSQQTGSGIDWVTETTAPDSAPNAVFAPDPATVGESDLTSPIFLVASSSILEFRNNYATETGFDGGVLEISIGGGAFQDIITAGGAFLAGGYNATLSTSFMNPLAGRMAWSGNSNGYLTTKVQMPAAANNQNVRLRWRMGHDLSVAATGWRIDSVKVYQYLCGDPIFPFPKVRADFDGDGKTDLSVYRPSEGNWYLNRSTTGFAVANWGLPSDQLTPGDFDGDHKTDTAVFRPNADSAKPDFYVLNSSNLTYSGYSWGLPGDIPVIEDYDGDGKSDIAVYRPSNHTFYVLNSASGSVLTFSNISFGVPVAGDFDGDGKGDFVTYSIDGWFISQSNINYATVVFIRWGAAGDKPVAADYDGDGKDDLAVFRPSDRTWYIRKSTGGNDFVQFGLADDIPVPGDYDGDGKSDIAVYRNGIWYLNRSTAGISIVQFGLSTDLPIPNRYLP